VRPENLAELPPAHRWAVVERLARHMLENGPDSADAAASVEVVSRMIDNLEVNERRDLSEMFARVPAAPRPLVLRLAQDHIVVAEPVLRWSALVDETFLQELCGVAGNEHLQVAAQRSDISPPMVEWLAERSVPIVDLALAHNLQAPLSRRTLMQLMKTAAVRRDVEEALCGREDLPDSAAGILMRRVSQRLDMEVGSPARRLSPSELRLALRTGDMDNGSQDGDIRGLSLDTLSHITRLARSGQLTTEHLLEFIHRGDLGAVAACFSRLAGIPTTVARRLVLQPSSEGLAVAARAAKLDRTVFDALLQLKTAKRLSSSPPAELSQKYDDVAVETAQSVMSFHSARRGRAVRVRRA
jgi:uncharacterized protein (DUF2336 family)